MKEVKGDSKWDFWHDMKYDDRNKQMAGNSYGVGKGPTVGKMRQSFMDPMPMKRKTMSSKPPKKVT